MSYRFNSLARGVAIAACIAAASVPCADARMGGGFSSGSRGGRTFSAPAPTSTAPRAAQPFQRTETPTYAPGGSGFGTAAQPGRRFGFGSGLMAGLVGAGLLGMLFGGGLFDGLSGLASMFGLLLQIALIVGLASLALRFFRRRTEPALAGGPSLRSAVSSPPVGGSSARPANAGGPVQIGPADYAAFERILVEAQEAYGRENLGRLGGLATAEMVRYFGSDIDDNRRRGVRNDVSGAKLLQGDLAEAWREGSTEYATVAMRFTTRDVLVDRDTGRVVSGNPNVPEQAVELWTFRRDPGRSWVLSAIQQGR